MKTNTILPAIIAEENAVIVYHFAKSATVKGGTVKGGSKPIKR